MVFFAFVFFTLVVGQQHVENIFVKGEATVFGDLSTGVQKEQSKIFIISDVQIIYQDKYTSVEIISENAIPEKVVKTLGIKKNAIIVKEKQIANKLVSSTEDIAFKKTTLFKLPIAPAHFGSFTKGDNTAVIVQTSPFKALNYMAFLFLIGWFVFFRLSSQYKISKNVKYFLISSRVRPPPCVG